MRRMLNPFNTPKCRKSHYLCFCVFKGSSFGINGSTAINAHHVDCSRVSWLHERLCCCWVADYHSLVRPRPRPGLGAVAAPMQALSVGETSKGLSVIFSSDARSFGATADAWMAAFPPSDRFRACCSALLLLEVGGSTRRHSASPL